MVDDGRWCLKLHFRKIKSRFKKIETAFLFIEINQTFIISASFTFK